MKVSRLPVDPGPAAWNEILPAARGYPALDGTLTADWLVIGAGFAGVAAARRLSQLRPGERITLLEARRVAEGPAGRNSGFMIDLPHDLASDDYGGTASSDRLHISQNRAAIDFAAEMVAEFGIDGEAFDRCGKINAAATEKGLAHNRDYARHLNDLGEGCESIDADTMREITGSTYFLGGLATPGTVMLQPALYMRGVAAGLARQGVSLHEESPVIGLTRDGASWRAETPSGAVRAPRIILAVNGHASSFGLYRRQLLHVFTYASMTDALSPEQARRLGGQPRWGITPADPMGTTVRRISGVGGDRLVIRNRFTCNPSLEADPGWEARIARDHDRAFAARFPMLKDVGMQYRWGGRLCLSLNNVPAFGEIEPGLFSAVCQNGLGTVKGTLAGLLAAELACGRRSALLDSFGAQDAPSRLPPDLLTRIGANARIRWQEQRAGREK